MAWTNRLRNVPIEQRLWTRVGIVHDVDSCWPWLGSRRHRYGEIYVNGVKVYAHRAAYATVNGPIPPGLVVMHHCDNPICVRPSHLAVGSQGDNIRDMFQKGRGSPPPLRRPRKAVA